MKTSKLNFFIYILDVLWSISGQGVQTSGDSIYIHGSTSVPEVLSQALADRGNELKDVTVYAAFAVGRCEAPYCKPEYKDAFNLTKIYRTVTYTDSTSLKGRQKSPSGTSVKWINRLAEGHDESLLRNGNDLQGHDKSEVRNEKAPQ